MTWTYVPQLLTSTATTGTLMRTRLLVGDTITTDQLLQDEEIYFVLSEQPYPNYAAADCADMIAARFARQVNTENSLLKVWASERHKHYVKLAERLRSNGPGVLPGGENAGAILADGYAGGISVAANEALEDNADNVLPPIKVGQDDYFSDGLDSDEDC